MPPELARYVEIGASPRASIAFAKAARASALLQGRDHVIPEDVQTIALPVLSHRVILSADQQHLRGGAGEVLGQLLQRVRVPAPGF